MTFVVLAVGFWGGVGSVVVLGQGGPVIGAAPQITVQPSPVVVPSGGQAEFTVEVTGSVTLVYQWRFKGMELSGETEASLLVRDVGVDQIGAYSVVVSNSLGSVTSEAAALSLEGQPQVVEQPREITVKEGDDLVIAVELDAVEPYRIEWFLDGLLVSEQTDRVLEQSSVLFRHSGLYTIRVENELGVGVSDPIAVDVLSPPRIVIPPDEILRRPGAPVRSTLGVEGSEPMDYLWSTAGHPAFRTGSPSLNLFSSRPAGTYQLEVSNEFGTDSTEVVVKDLPSEIAPPEWDFLALFETNAEFKPGVWPDSEGASIVSFNQPNHGNRITIGEKEYHAPGGWKDVLAKIDRDGAIQWSREFGEPRKMRFTGYHVGRDDVIYIVGYLLNGGSFGGIQSALVGATPFVGSLASDGTTRWVTALPPIDEERVIIPQSSPEGGVYLFARARIGQESDSAGQTVSDAGVSVIKINAEGDIEWILPINGKDPHLNLSASTVDIEGNAYFMARLNSSIEVAGVEIPFRPDLSHFGDVFFKVNRAGGVDWHHLMVSKPNRVFAARSAPTGGMFLSVSGVGETSWTLNGVQVRPIPPWDPGTVILNSAGEMVGTNWGSHRSMRTTFGHSIRWDGYRIADDSPRPDTGFEKERAVYIGEFEKYGTELWRRTIHWDDSDRNRKFFFGEPKVDVDGVIHVTGMFSAPTVFDDGRRYEFDSPRVFLARLAPVSSPHLPRIVEPPEGAVRMADESVSFSVGVEMSDSVSYQWFRNGAAIPGANSSELVLEDLSFEDQAHYRVHVGNEVGFRSSTPAFLRVNSPPRLLKVPERVFVPDGMSASLRVEADGTEPLIFIWLKDGRVLNAANTPVLDLVFEGESLAGEYQVRLSNSFGEVTSDPIRVQEIVAPEILTQPESADVKNGDTVSLQVEVRAFGRVRYQWFRDGEPIHGANSRRIEFDPIQLSDRGEYSVVVWNEAGTTESTSALVTVAGPPPSIVEFPSAVVEFNEGERGSIEVSATGEHPLNYEWFRGDDPEPVHVGRVLMFEHAFRSAAGRYRVRVTNVRGSVLSDEIAVRVLPREVTPGRIDSFARFESSESIEVTSVSVGRHGYTVVGGNATGELIFGDEVNFSTDSSVGYVAAVNLNLGLRWAFLVESGSDGGATVDDVSVTPGGETYIVGSNSGSLRIQNRNGRARDSELYVGRFGFDSSREWVQGIQIPNFVWGTGRVTALDDACVVVAAILPGKSSVGVARSELFETDSEHHTAVVLSLRANSGDLGWFHRLSASGELEVVGLEPDLDGGAYIAGKFSGRFEIGEHVLVSKGAVDAFLIRLSSSGAIQSAISWGGPNDDILTAIISDIQGRVYAIGQWSDEWHFEISGFEARSSEDSNVLLVNAEGQLEGLLPSWDGQWGRPDAFGNLFTLRVDDQLVGDELNVQKEGETLQALRIEKQDTKGGTLWRSSIVGADLKLGAIDHIGVEWRGHATMAVRSRGLDLPGRPLTDNGQTGQQVDVFRVSASGDYFRGRLRVPLRTKIEVNGELALGHSFRWGESIELEARVDGLGDFAYLWLKDNRVIDAGNSPSLRIDSADVINNGVYTLLAGSQFGVGASSNVGLHVVRFVPEILRHPQSATVDLGTSVLFEVEVGEGPEPKFQWFHDRVGVIEGATGPTLLIDPVTIESAGRYRVRVSTDGVSRQEVSRVAQLTVNARLPVILTQPEGASVPLGQPFDLFVATDGSEVVTYQWFRNGEPIPDETDWFIRRPVFSLADVGTYHVVVTGVSGAIQSASAEVTANVTAPTIVVRPEVQTALIGEDVVFDAAIEGEPELKMQWFRGTSAIAVATGSSLTIEGVELADAGEYRLVVTDVNGVEIEYMAILRVVSLPTIVSEPNEPFQYVGRPFLLHSRIEGEVETTYQWHLDGTEITGATGATLAVVEPGLSDSGSYSVVVEFEGRSVSSDPLVVEIAGAPEILEAPDDALIEEGEGFTASLVLNVPDEAVDIRWSRDDVEIDGAVGLGLAWDAVTLEDSGRYTAAIANPAGSVRYDGFRLSVLPVADLRLERSGALLLLVWMDEADLFVIESADRLGEDASWSVVEQNPIALGGQRTLPIAAEGHYRYFRLRLATDGGQTGVSP